jgi:hypothetical protein
MGPPAGLEVAMGVGPEASEAAAPPSDANMKALSLEGEVKAPQGLLVQVEARQLQELAAAPQPTGRHTRR